jgi:hypothetical protein
MAHRTVVEARQASLGMDHRIRSLSRLVEALGLACPGPLLRGREQPDIVDADPRVT